jgi:hypothetical protein
MMAIEFIAICFGIIVILIVPAWFLPRKFGIIGIPIAHVVISLLTLGAIIFDFIRGVVPDPDFIWILGNICWIAIANVIFVPVTMFAAYRNSVARKKLDPATDLS